jgi:hypothetical protein
MQPDGPEKLLTLQAGIPGGSPAGVRSGVERNPLCHLGRPLSQEEVLTGVLPDLTRRIVAAVQPTRVILFGSAAREEMNPDSDLDVLVIVADGRDQNQAAEKALTVS